MEMKKKQNGKSNCSDISVMLNGKNCASAVDQKDVAVAAYYAWEKDGKPAGRDAEYWRVAETQIRSNGRAPAQAP